MNSKKKENRCKRWEAFAKRKREIILFCVIALALFVMMMQVFGAKEKSELTTSYSANELRIARLLEKMEGVGEAEVIICETEGGVESVVVLCEGANNFNVILSVREAVATALNTQPKKVKIYLKKE